MTLSPTDWVILVWLFALGGTVGSFLNVVVHRLPAGMSLIAPPSHCPVCKKAIRWHDNVPIFGWICLKGRCRDCGVRISARYPLVEAVTAGLFVLLGALGPVAGGVNLPGRAAQVAGGLIVPERGLVELCGIYGYHLVLLCTLLCAGLIAWDGVRVPGRLFLPAIVVGACAPLMWPQLHTMPAVGAWTGFLGGVMDTAAGGLAGGAVGWLASRPLAREQRAGLWLAVVSVGLILGWQAGVVLGAGAAVAGLLGRLGRGPESSFSRLMPVVWLGAGALAWIVAWAWIAAWFLLPG
jgi:leader peptidase (prepilin peptidase)/N-methyltransferase